MCTECSCLLRPEDNIRSPGVAGACAPLHMGAMENSNEMYHLIKELNETINNYKDFHL